MLRADPCLVLQPTSCCLKRARGGESASMNTLKLIHLLVELLLTLTWIPLASLLIVSNQFDACLFINSI